MKFSIIIPVYNTGAYLEKCVRSALITADEDCEILIVDDGSNDGISGNLCDQLAETNSHIIRVVHQQNKGLGGARNTGIEQANGEYLLFLDSDDSLHPDAISRIRQTIEEYEVDIVTFNITTEDENGKLEKLPSGYINRSPFALVEIPEFILELPSACNKVWRRELFLKSGVRFPEKVWYEDIRTTIKLYALANKIYTIPDYLYIYFQRSGSITRSDNLDRNSEIMDAMDDILCWYQEKRLYDQYESVLCALTIENVYLYATIRVLRNNLFHPLLEQFHTYTEIHFPNYRHNSYLDRLPRSKKLVYNLLEKKMFRLLQLLFVIRDEAKRLIGKR